MLWETRPNDYVALIGLLVAVFAAAGVFNTIGTAAQKASFERWGYPAWWCRVSGVLELAVATLIALPGHPRDRTDCRGNRDGRSGLTVMRHREFPHLAPIGVYAALLLVAGIAF